MHIIKIEKPTETDKMISLKSMLAKNNVCILFYAKWCGHCTTLLPEWNTFKEKYNSSTRNSNLFKIAEIESEAIPELRNRLPAHQTQFSGFPTISMFNNGVKLNDYDGERKGPIMFKIIKSLFNKTKHNTNSNNNTITTNKPQILKRISIKQLKKPMQFQQQQPQPPFPMQFQQQLNNTPILMNINGNSSTKIKHKKSKKSKANKHNNNNNKK